MRATIVETVGEYARDVGALLSELGGAGPMPDFPVLHPRASLLPPPEANTEQTADGSELGDAPPPRGPWPPVADCRAADVMRWRGAPPRAPGHPGTGTVLGFGDADWALPAMLHAHADGRTFAWYDDVADLLTAAARGSGPLTVCAPPQRLTRDVQQALEDALSFRAAGSELAAIGLPARPLSYLTARTLPILSRVVAAHQRHRAARTRTALGLFAERMTGVGDDEVLTCLVEEKLDGDAVRAAPTPELLMMWGHSREDLFHLGRDGLCGRSLEYGGAAPDAFVPSCVVDGGCVKPGGLVQVQELGANTVVMGGCNILRLGDRGLFAPEFSLAFSAQEGGASAVVTASGVVMGSPIEFLFLYRLLRGGLPIGEAVRVLNAALPFLGPDAPSYQVLGEGDRVLFDPPRDRGERWCTETADGMRAEFRGVHAEYLTIDLPRFDDALQVRVAEDGTGADARLPELYFAAVPTPSGGATVYLYGPRRLEDADLTVRLDLRRPGADAAVAVASAMTTHQAYARLLRAYQPKLKNQEQEWRSTAAYLVRQATKARYDVRACAEADRRAEAAEAAVHAIDRDLCRHYVERAASQRGFTFHEQCLFEDGTFTVAEHFVDSACPYCGDQVLGRVVRSQPVPAAERRIGICRTCGTIGDRPARIPAPTLLLDPVLRPGQARPVSLELHNPEDRRVRGWAGITVRRARQFGYVIEPALHEVVLEPGGRQTVTSLLSTTEGKPNDAEFLRGYWSCELAVAVAQRTIWTASRPGAVRRPTGDLLHGPGTGDDGLAGSGDMPNSPTVPAI